MGGGAHMGSNRNNVRAKSPYFFSIIFSRSPRTRNHGLRIPKEFMRQYRTILPNLVFLKVPNGALWPVELKKSNDDAWLEWHEFKEHYSIGYGYFLVFRYDGNSHFHVVIFDRSASEIEYLFSSTGSDGNYIGKSKFQANAEDVEVEYSVEILQEFPICQNTMEKSRVSYFRRCKKTGSNSTCLEPNLRGRKIEQSSRDESIEILNDFESNQRWEKCLPPQFQFSKKKSKTEYPLCGTRRAQTNFIGKSPDNAKDVEVDDTVQIREEIPICQSTSEKSPVSYSRTCKKMKSNSTRASPKLNRGCKMKESSRCDSVKILGCQVPKVKESATDDSVETVVDFLANQRKWEKSLPRHLRFSRKTRPRPTNKSKNAYYHKPFVQSTGAQGDRLKPLNLDVEESSYSSMQGVGGIKRCQHSKFRTGRKQLASNTGRVGALQSARAFKSENPFFTVTMRSTNVASYILHIPRTFMEYLSKQHKNVILQVPHGKTWSLKYSIYPQRVRMQNGWMTFARENFLAVGDVCVFELINGVQNLMNVFIFRAAEDDLLPQKRKTH